MTWNLPILMSNEKNDVPSKKLESFLEGPGSSGKGSSRRGNTGESSWDDIDLSSKILKQEKVMGKSESAHVALT